MNYDAAQLAKKAAIEVTESSGRQKYVAGAIGPTNRTLSISPSVEKPEYRNISMEFYLQIFINIQMLDQILILKYSQS